MTSLVPADNIKVYDLEWPSNSPWWVGPEVEGMFHKQAHDL